MDRHIKSSNGQDDVGCEALWARLADLCPRLYLAGHIHEAHGTYIHTWDTAEPAFCSIR